MVLSVARAQGLSNIVVMQQNASTQKSTLFGPSISETGLKWFLKRTVYVAMVNVPHLGMQLSLIHI